jgi:hypothetical protein
MYDLWQRVCNDGVVVNCEECKRSDKYCCGTRTVAVFVTFCIRNGRRCVKLLYDWSV